MMKAAGKMGWSESQFWFSTPSYFFAAYSGHQEQETDRATISLAHARLMAYWAAAPHLDKKFRITDIATLPWDKTEPNYPEISQEELDDFSKRADEAIKRYNEMQSNGINSGT